MASWITSKWKETEEMRKNIMQAATEKAAAAREYAVGTQEYLKTADLREAAAHAGERAKVMASDAREGAGKRVAGVAAVVQDGVQHAHMRAHTMEGRMRMEAAVAKDYAEAMKYKGDKIVRKRLKGDGPPTADEVVEEMDALARKIRGGSAKGLRITALRKWAADLEADLTYEEELPSEEAAGAAGTADGDASAAGAEGSADSAAEAARAERLAKLDGDGGEGAGGEPEPAPEPAPPPPQNFKERLELAKKTAFEGVAAAKKRAAELDEQFKLSEKAAVAAAVATQKANEAALSLKERGENYRAGKGFVIEVPEGMRRVRVVTYKECLLRSQVVPHLISSFAAEKATPGSESVKCLTAIFKHCLHGTEAWHAALAEAVSCKIPPAVRGRTTKKPMMEQLTIALQAAMVEAEIETIRVNLTSNNNAAKQLRSDIEAVASSQNNVDVQQRLKLSSDLLSMNAEEVALTTKLYSLLDTRSTVTLADNQSECDRVVASTKQQYHEELEALGEKVGTIGEEAEQIESAQEAAEMEFADADAKISAELEQLREREASLQAELSELSATIASLETERETARAARDGTTASVGAKKGAIDLTTAQVGTTESSVKLELAAVEEVEKVLDDVFDEIARDLVAKAESVSAQSASLTTEGLQLLQSHVGYMKGALESLQSKIGFCSSELHERIEKRESMIKMGMENVADSLIPGFDKLEEKFIELVQMMKSLVGDFEPLAEKAEAAAAGAEEGGPDSELRRAIGAALAKVVKLQEDLETQAGLLEGKIEMEEVKWQGAAVPMAAGVAAAPVPSGGVADVDSIVSDLSAAQD